MAYESAMEQSNVNSLKEGKLSRGAKALRALALAQQDLVDYNRLMDHGSPEANRGFGERVAIRNHRLKDLEKLPWDFSDAPPFNDEVTVHLGGLDHKGNEPRHGYSNDFTAGAEVEENLYRELDHVGAAWIARLSTGEIKAVANYNGDATAYAKAMAEESSILAPEAIAGLHSALAKAPKLATPVRTYAGISNERSKGIQAQGDSGEIVLNRIQSASANPAQVNGFMFSFDNDGSSKEEIAVEFIVDRVASLSAFNVHRGEMELLIPPGKYAVRERLENVNYYWPEKIGGKLSGRTSSFTYVVEPAT